MKCTETHCYLKLGKKWLLVIVLHPLVHSYRTHDNCKELSWCLSIWQVECKGTASWNFISMFFGSVFWCHLHLHTPGSFCDQECSINIYMLRTVYIDFMIVISWHVLQNSLTTIYDYLNSHDQSVSFMLDNSNVQPRWRISTKFYWGLYILYL